MCVALRNGISRISGLPFDSQCLIPVICNDVTILVELCFRSVGFMLNCLSSERSLIKFVTIHGLISGIRSLVCRNALFCQTRYGQGPCCS